ncbi:MAG: GNAT family N-acetyltransferase [Candidatus Coproplasma sp.]
MGEEFWGKGIATAALKELCVYIFENTDIIRLYAEPFTFNKASCRVLEKAGFTREGVLKSNAVKCGAVLDMALYAKVKGE